MFKVFKDFLDANPKVKASAVVFLQAVITAVLFTLGLDNEVVQPVVEEVQAAIP